MKKKQKKKRMKRKEERRKNKSTTILTLISNVKLPCALSPVWPSPLFHPLVGVEYRICCCTIRTHSLRAHIETPLRDGGRTHRPKLTGAHVAIQSFLGRDKVWTSRHAAIAQFTRAVDVMVADDYDEVHIQRMLPPVPVNTATLKG